MQTTENSSLLTNDLKRETAPLHEALESRVDILSEGLTLERYKFILQKFYGFYLPLESRISALNGFKALGLDPLPRRKLPNLISDLGKLGLSSGAVEALPVCPELPGLTSLAHVWGSMYVLEGATLGGQIIRRELRKRPEFHQKDWFDFYNSYGDKVGTRWKEFCAALNRSGQETPIPGLRQAVIEGAVQTFEKLDKWLAA